MIVGGLDWGLVAIAEFELVAWLFGEDLGTTNAATRIVYGLVGLAAVIASPRWSAGASPPTPIARQLLHRARRAVVADVNPVQPLRAAPAAGPPRQEKRT